jgi:type III secretion protein V
MDGAMKFIKGDAIAGVLVACVNLVAGSAVGIFREGLPLAEALSNFALLAIGDGLASLFPSLCVAVAAGLVVTRVGAPAGEEISLGAQLARHFVQDERAPWTVACLCLALALLPGMPAWAFIAVGIAMAGVGYCFQGPPHQGPAPCSSDPSRTDGGMQSQAARRGRVVLDLGPGLEKWGDADSELQVRILPELRRGLVEATGVMLPPILIRISASYLSPGGYSLMVDGVPLCRGQVKPGSGYVAAAPAELALLRVSASTSTHPLTGQPASCVDLSALAALEVAGLRPLTAGEWMAAHLLAQLRKRAELLVGVQEVQVQLDEVEKDSPILVRELNRKVPLPVLADVLRRLVQEEVSIRELEPILEALVAPAAEGDAAALAERCRVSLRRQLSWRHAPGGSLFAWLLDPSTEEVLRTRGEALDPVWVGDLILELRKAAGAGQVQLLVAPDVRRSLQRLCEGAVPDMLVLTYAELEPTVQIRPLGRISVKGGSLRVAA